MISGWKRAAIKNMAAGFGKDDGGMAKYGTPEIFNTDHPSHGLQGQTTAGQRDSQFTSYEFTQVLKDAEIKIPMEGKGRWPPLIDCFAINFRANGQPHDRAPVAISEIRMRLSQGF